MGHIFVSEPKEAPRDTNSHYRIGMDLDNLHKPYCNSNIHFLFAELDDGWMMPVFQQRCQVQLSDGATCEAQHLVVLMSIRFYSFILPKISWCNIWCVYYIYIHIIINIILYVYQRIQL